MKSLREYLRDVRIKAEEKGKLPKGLTLCDYQQLCEIEAGRQSETISETVADVCRRCGLKVVEEGVGWIIRRKEDE